VFEQLPRCDLEVLEDEGIAGASSMVLAAYTS